VCRPGEVAVSDNDGTSFSTQVPVVRHAWVPTATSYRARHLMPPLPKASASAEPIVRTET
jgi:hypothetical protein